MRPYGRHVAALVGLALVCPAMVAAQQPTPATAAPVAAAAAAGHPPPPPAPPPPKPAADGRAAPLAAVPPPAATPSTRRNSQTSDLKDAVARIQKRLDEEVGKGNKPAYAVGASTRSSAAGARVVPPRTPPRIALSWRTSLVWPEELAAPPAPVPRTSERITLIWRSDKQ